MLNEVVHSDLAPNFLAPNVDRLIVSVSSRSSCSLSAAWHVINVRWLPSSSMMVTLAVFSRDEMFATAVLGNTGPVKGATASLACVSLVEIVFLPTLSGSQISVLTRRRWHFPQFCFDLHSATAWPGFKQYQLNRFCFTTCRRVFRSEAHPSSRLGVLLQGRVFPVAKYARPEMFFSPWSYVERSRWWMWLMILRMCSVSIRRFGQYCLDFAQTIIP